MGRNLSYQFKNAIDQSFDGGGSDKHSSKQHTGNNLDTVYSYAERSNLIELSHQIGDYIKANYSSTKQVIDIKPSMIQEFLNIKAGTCNQATLGQYASRVHKLEGIVNSVYKGGVSWYSDLVVPASKVGDDKIRDIAMSREDYQAILSRAEAMGSTSQAPIAVELAGRFGMRVSETCKLEPRDINFEKMELHIHESKGGRSRDIGFKKEDIPFLQRIIVGKEPAERIVSIKEDSVNKYLARAETAIGIRNKYQEADTGIHCIRKMVAQEKYDQFRESGMDKKEALDAVSTYLGHGKDRIETMQQYVLNIH